MNILFVIDQYDSLKNGTTVSARRFAEALEKDGNKVSILTAGKEGNDKKFVVDSYKLPKWIDFFLKGNDMVFAKPNDEIIKKALEGQDIVHFYMPFWLSKETLKIVEEKNIPHTTAFHVQPENITYAVNLGKCTLVNNILYAYFRKFFNKFNHIHCPSEFIANLQIN